MCERMTCKGAYLVFAGSVYQRKLQSSAERKGPFSAELSPGLLARSSDCVWVASGVSGSSRHPSRTHRPGVQASGCPLWTGSGFPALGRGVTSPPHCPSPQGLLGPSVTTPQGQGCPRRCRPGAGTAVRGPASEGRGGVCIAVPFRPLRPDISRQFKLPMGQGVTHRGDTVRLAR